MRVSRVLPGRTVRLMLMALGLVTFVASPFAQTPSAGGQQAAAQAPDQFKFDSDSELIIYLVSADKAADFEDAMGQVKKLYNDIDDADLKSAGNFRMMKPAAASTPDKPLQYWILIDSVNKNASYDPSKAIFYTKPGPDANTPGTMLMPRDQAQALYDKLKAGITGLQFIPFKKVLG
jgi:hypothetical protein